MSMRIFPDDVLFAQRLLKADDLYQGELTGEWNAETEAASRAFERRADALMEELGRCDSRSEANIRTLTLAAQRHARLFLRELQEAGMTCRIISGSRTYAEQDRLYRQGRSGAAGPVVTNARGGQSNHNFGIAWDIALFTRAGGYVTDGAPYREAKAAAMTDALEWGGDWERFPDRPHYQLKVPFTLAQLKARFEIGDRYTAFA